ncbi:MAG TPA: DMT family transporter [Thermoanaerobaculia bacterium]|nr:DMT family transporter [Thermoanaerobaculia bacterium]
MTSDLEREPLSRRWRADAVLIAVTLAWGADFVLVKNLLGAVPPLPFLFWRFAAATALCALALPGRRRTPRLGPDGLVLGIVLALGMGLQILGQVETSASHASFLTGLASVFTPAAAYLMTRKLPTRENGVGIALAGAGFVLMTLPTGGAINRGDLLVFGCGVTFAFYIVLMAERSARHDPVWFTVIQLVVTTAAAGVAVVAGGGLAALARGVTPLLDDAALLWQAVFLVVIGTAGTYVFQTWAQGHMSATHAAIIYTLEPVVTALLAAWFLGERLGTRGWLGGLLVLAGIVVSEIRLRPRS